MNTEHGPLYTPAEPWSGRDDGPGPEHARWHSVIAPLEDESPAGIAVLGFASDEGVERNGGRQGAAAGPAALRQALGGLAVHEPLALYDAGTVTTQGDDLEGGHDELSARVQALVEAGHLTIILGGGHETAFGSHRGLFAGVGPAQIINLDAHFDLRSESRATSGTPFLQISELVGQKDFDYSVLGISQPNNTTVLFDTARELGVTIHLDEQLAQLSINEATQLATQLVEESAHDHLHLSIDMDVLPGDQAPGVSAPASLGVSFDRIRAIAVALAATGKLALVDIVEINPRFDLDNRTAKLGARLINDIAVAHAQARGHN
ncbi:formimidoylglutamase [Corynebacterium ammoniagenes]|uniref:formimidoylglutamase n=1 Tax=Corynebacterium ammoniagenes TaxID=1697 RepID=UPI0014592D0D|nr:formimidoylglutamase [Corynebacterium ammoniagenes]NMF31433.1 formimidoylglutamase [Corynebacterium ammoniagenes]